jgi:hypothetical protein
MELDIYVYINTYRDYSIYMEAETRERECLSSLDVKDRGDWTKVW